jgi:hypothetical protein
LLEALSCSQKLSIIFFSFLLPLQQYILSLVNVVANIVRVGIGFCVCSTKAAEDRAVLRLSPPIDFWTK